MVRIYCAYGRDVNSLEEFRKDFRQGRDFKFYNGMYFSSRDRALMLQGGICVLSLKDRYCVDLRTMKFFENQPKLIDRIM